MKKLLIATISLVAAYPVFAQTAHTAADAKAQNKLEQAEIKADKKINDALTDQARANVKADAKAKDKKLKAQHKAQKKIDDANEDVIKAENKAAADAAKDKK